MTRAERIEIALAVASTAALRFAIAGVSWHPAVGVLVADVAALLLGQGLLRDVSRLVWKKKGGEKRKIVCLCAESSVGVLMILVAGSLLLVGVDGTVALGGDQTTAAFAATLVAGFILKSWVVKVGGPLGLRLAREANHEDILVA